MGGIAASQDEPEPEKRVPVNKPTQMVRVGKRDVSVVGYSSQAARDHLHDHLEKPHSERWCKVACMARTMFQRDTRDNRDKVRRNVRGLFNGLLEQNIFLVIEYGGKNRAITAMKIYERDGGIEQRVAIEQLVRLRARGLISQKKAMMAQRILGTEPSPEPPHAEP